MLFNNEDIVWTVSAMVPDAFAISLNAKFSKSAIQSVYKQESFQKTVWFKMGLKSKKLPAQFIHFKQGILPQVFHCNTGEGVWLGLSEYSSRNPEHALTYFTHNADHVVDQLWMIRAFTAWAEAARLVMEKETSLHYRWGYGTIATL